MKKSEYDWLIQAKRSLDRAAYHYIFSNQQLMWEQLLVWAEAEWELQHYKRRDRKKTTLRQKEVQRLWQQRGLLERTKANLRIFQEQFGTELDHADVNKVIALVEFNIEGNQRYMNTIKERIPK